MLFVSRVAEISHWLQRLLYFANNGFWFLWNSFTTHFIMYPTGYLGNYRQFLPHALSALSPARGRMLLVRPKVTAAVGGLPCDAASGVDSATHAPPYLAN